MERINLNKLYYFYVVASEGSIKAASQKLHLTQPTISTQIKELEDELGFDLFVRKHRKLEITPSGRKLQRRSEKLFVLADQIVSTLPKSGQRDRIQIRIGAITPIASALVYDFSIKLWKDTTTAVSVNQGSFKDLMNLMDKGELNFILSDTSFQRSQRYQSINLGSDRIIAVTTPQYAHLKKGFPESLNEAPYIAFSGSGRLQEDINYFFDRKNIHPERIGEVDDITLMRTLVESGDCFAFMPYRSVMQALKTRRLLKIGELKSIKSNLWVITPRMDRQRSLTKRLLNDYFLRHQ